MFRRASTHRSDILPSYLRPPELRTLSFSPTLRTALDIAVPVLTGFASVEPLGSRYGAHSRKTTTDDKDAVVL